MDRVSRAAGPVVLIKVGILLQSRGKKKGRAGHGQDQAGVQYRSVRHLHPRDKRGHLHRPDDVRRASERAGRTARR